MAPAYIIDLIPAHPVGDTKPWPHLLPQLAGHGRAMECADESKLRYGRLISHRGASQKAGTPAPVSSPSVVPMLGLLLDLIAHGAVKLQESLCLGELLEGDAVLEARFKPPLDRVTGADVNRRAWLRLSVRCNRPLRRRLSADYD